MALVPFRYGQLSVHPLYPQSPQSWSRYQLSYQKSWIYQRCFPKDPKATSSQWQINTRLQSSWKVPCIILFQHLFLIRKKKARLKFKDLEIWGVSSKLNQSRGGTLSHSQVYRLLVVMLTCVYFQSLDTHFLEADTGRSFSNGKFRGTLAWMITPFLNPYF